MYNKFYNINVKIIPLILIIIIELQAHSYIVTGKVTTSTEPVKYASVTFINENDTTQKYTAITDSLVPYL